MKITIYNDFHGTEVTLNAKNGRLTESQMKRAHRELCGSKDCCCSGDFGYRGPHEDGFVGIEPIYDIWIGRVVGGIVHFTNED